MAYYRKRPIIIQAVHCSVALHNFSHDWKALPKWLAEAYEQGKVIPKAEGLSIATLEGEMLAAPEDMLICGVQGELYPCKREIFAKTYDYVPDSEVPGA